MDKPFYYSLVIRFDKPMTEEQLYKISTLVDDECKDVKSFLYDEVTYIAEE